MQGFRGVWWWVSATLPEADVSQRVLVVLPLHGLVVEVLSDEPGVQIGIKVYSLTNGNTILTKSASWIYPFISW